MTMTSSHPSHRRIDLPSLILLVIGIIFGVLAYWLVTDRGANPLVLVPSVVAATIGSTHLLKRQAGR